MKNFLKNIPPFSPRIIFLGGKNVGYGCLEHLLLNKYNVVGVVVNPSDSDEGAWYKSITPLVNKYNIPIFCFDSINSPESRLCLRDLQPDLIIVVYYDQILKKEVIDIPPMGCINLHMALAEEYRGCFPTTWAIINGEVRTGITIHYIDTGIDSGDIIIQTEVPIFREDTGRDLYDRCTLFGINLFKQYIKSILEGKITVRPQEETALTKYYSRDFPSHEIDFSKGGEQVYNQIRAMIFEPFVLPFFYVGNRKFRIVEEKE